MKISTTWFLVPIVSLMIPLAVKSQESPPPESKVEANSPTGVLQEIKQHIDENQWAKASALMTEDAWDDFCTQLVMQCVTLSNSDLQFPLPSLEEAQDKATEALEKHGLDSLELDAPTFEMKFEFGGDDDESAEHARQSAKKHEQIFEKAKAD